MQKMNKEELIEYFIELLGDNHVLGKYLSIDEIRKRLNENIENVTYEPEKGIVIGSYNLDKRTINLDLDKTSSELDFKILIVHEFLHALSYSVYQNENFETQKRGFEISQKNMIEPFGNTDETWIYSKDRHIRCWGKSINEGITDLLTEEILKTNIYRYEEERDVTRVLFGVVGKDNMLDRYFSKVKSNDEINNPLEYFFYDILERDYQITKTKNVDYTIKFLLYKTVQFSDWLTTVIYNTNGNLDDDQKKSYDINYNRLCHIIEALAQNALETIKQPDDFERKTAILESMIEFHNSDISMNIDTPKLVNDVQKVIFDKNKFARLGKRIWQYKQFTKNGLDFAECGKSIEEYCIDHEIINKTDFSKADMLRCIFKYFGEDLKFLPDASIEDILSNFSYKIVDGNYELYYHGINPQIAKEVNTNYFDVNEYKRLTDDMAEKNVDRRISQFTNSLIGVDDDKAKIILNEAFHDLHEDLALTNMLEIIKAVQQIYGNSLNEIFLDNLQEFYITKADCSKNDMLLDILKNNDIENIHNFYYQKIGSHYELIDQQASENADNISTSWEETCIYNEAGTQLYLTNMFEENYENGQKTYYYLYDSENNNLLEKAKQFNQAQLNKFSEIRIIENDVRFERIENDEIVSYTYTLNKSGGLELATPELPRRIVDDMTQLDIQLMQETEKAGVTITDMKGIAQMMMPEQSQRNGQENLKEND